MERTILENKIVKIKKVFSKSFVSFLYNNCKKPFELKSKNICFLISDCHGLTIYKNFEKTEKDPYFPYSIKNWNIFCIKMQNIMFKYCDQFNIDKSQLTPHSCWIEKWSVEHGEFQHIKLDDTDNWLNLSCNVDEIIHYRIVYFLKNSDPNVGLTIINENDQLDILGEENSLCIVSTTNNSCYRKLPKNTDETLVLMFNWYLHPPKSSFPPAWQFPNKYNYNSFKSYIEFLLKSDIKLNSVQKILYKFYLILFQKKLKEKLAIKNK